MCGACGVFVGWRPSMWEAAAVYHNVYRLNPFGPHRPFADRLLGRMRETCVRCGGHTVLTVDEETWRNCTYLVWGLGTLHCLSQQEPAAPRGG